MLNPRRLFARPKNDPPLAPLVSENPPVAGVDQIVSQPLIPLPASPPAPSPAVVPSAMNTTNMFGRAPAEATSAAGIPATGGVIAPTGIAAPVAAAPRSASMLNEINQYQAAPAQIEHSFGKRLGSGLWNAFKSWGASGGQGGLAGLVGALGAGGAISGFSPESHGEMKKQMNLTRLWGDYGKQAQAEKIQTESETRRIANQNIVDDNRRADETFKANDEFRKSEQQRRIDDRTSRESTARLRGVAGILKDLPSYDPSDPRFAELTKALGDVNLPITAKDAKKKVDLKQDQRTGEWSAIVTDPTGQIETRAVTNKDGSVLKTTPQVVVAGEYGMTRQNDQQDFTADQNEKNRQNQIRLKQMGNDLQTKLTEYRTVQGQIENERNFERRKALQERAAQLQQEGKVLTQQMQQENMTFQSTVPKRK